MLAVDIGNTKTRFAAFKDDRVAARRTLPTREMTLDDAIRAMEETASMADEPALWIASVYPDANKTIGSAAERLGYCKRFITSAGDHIVGHRLSTPDTTGVDRLLAALAAGERHFPDAQNGYIVVQCGTAATIDFVDGERRFAGGYILPGPSLWLSSLAQAANLPDLSAEPIDWDAIGPGDNTRDAIRHGLVIGLTAAVASAALFLDVPKDPLPIASTGGWSREVASFLGKNAVNDPDLLLHGIRIFAQRMG